jgi:hypothetical protein
MARKSGYSKYAQGVQKIKRNLRVKAVNMVYTLPEVTSLEMASDGRMFLENTKNLIVGAQNT